jgi:hypothetical protein
VGRERGYDGANRWGRAFDDPGTTVFRMPPTLQGKWTDWAGRWGVPLGGVSAEGPLSPGVQPVEIQCARVDNDPVNCDPGPRASSAGLSARVLPSGSSPGLTAKSCESWIGAGIGATVCEPRRLLRAVLGRKLGDKGDVKIYGTRRRGLNDSAPGVAQLATARPLHDGSRLRIRGRLSRSTRVLVRALDRSRKKLIVAEFPVGARRPRLVAASFEQTTKLRLRVRGRRRERPRVSLGGVEPVAVRFSRLRRR